MTRTRHEIATSSSWIKPFVVMLFTACLLSSELVGAEPQGIYDKSNLVAWCIVPFDAARRGPAERAAMLRRLGIRRVAYDWRQEHVESFEQEILQYKKHGLEYFAFWSWHDSMEPLIKKHSIRPQIWYSMPEPVAKTQEARVHGAAHQALELVQKTRSLGLRLGLYNHGGWSGEPENLIAVCRYLRDHHGADHVGIVYNFHHGHDHIARFSDAFSQMLPYLICVNINGMVDPGSFSAERKILPVGRGQHEPSMLKTVRSQGYQGPIGILDHRPEVDAERSLRENLDGLQRLLEGPLAN